MKNSYDKKQLHLTSSNTSAIMLSAIPSHKLDNLCIATLRAIERYFELPGVREEYEEWLKEYRKQNKS